MQHWCARWWCRLIAWTIGARIRVHGTENVRADGSYVYMANHSSLIDTPAMFAYLPYQFKIMAKKELFYIPFMGWHLWTSGNFPVDRSDGRKTARSLRAVIEGIRAGKSLVVFPEGTRTLAPRPGRVEVIIGEPIATSDYNEKRLGELIERTRAAIQSRLEDAPHEDRKPASTIASSISH
jgi:1-acyl-sn-glycerol-3-phosphate acyltransferase